MDAGQRHLGSLIVAAAIVLSACATPSRTQSPGPASPPPLFEKTFFGMGTIWKIEVRLPGDMPTEALASRLPEIVLSDEMVFSDWLEESELRRLENRGLAKWHKASERFLKGLRLSREAWQDTRGAFDPTVGAVLWKAAPRPVGFGQLELRGERFRFRKDPRRLTFGGIVKGLSGGAIAEILEAHGSRHYRINAGGGNVTLRVSSDEEPWSEARAYGLETGLIWHIARSRSMAPDAAGPRQHIVDPRDPSRSLRKAVVIACRQREGRRIEDEAALTDAWSKAPIVEQRYELPDHCRRI